MGGGPRVMLSLVLVNVLWAGNPVMQKFLLADFAPLQVAWLRIVSGAAVLAVWILTIRLLPIAHERRAGSSGGAIAVEPPPTSPGWRLGMRAVGIGAVVFFVTPMLVTHGLNASLAVHNSFITGLEPVITIVLARVVLGERLRAAGWLILAVALMGFALLSGVGGSWRDVVSTTFWWGNLLLLLAMAGEAVYSIMGAPLVARMAPATVLLTALSAGAALLTAVLIFTNGVPGLAQFTLSSALGLLWSGPVTTAFCYLVWLTSLRHVPVNAAAFTLFIQPLLGAALGYALLGERLEGPQLLGAGLILGSLLVYARRVD